jgi:hypothetical protein
VKSKKTDAKKEEPKGAAKGGKGKAADHKSPAKTEVMTEIHTNSTQQRHTTQSDE